MGESIYISLSLSLSPDGTAEEYVPRCKEAATIVCINFCIPDIFMNFAARFHKFKNRWPFESE